MFFLLLFEFLVHSVLFCAVNVFSSSTLTWYLFFRGVKFSVSAAWYDCFIYILNLLCFHFRLIWLDFFFDLFPVVCVCWLSNLPGRREKERRYFHFLIFSNWNIVFHSAEQRCKNKLHFMWFRKALPCVDIRLAFKLDIFGEARENKAERLAWIEHLYEITA